jgi:type 1 fimbriae regulatory protein FimB/type 1 fimbriae regulatory protein FimE
MANQALRFVVPTPINGTVPPRRKPNSETRDREHLTEAEVERLMKAAGKNRYGHRDATMILIAFRHGLRPVEVCNLKWDSIDLAKACIHVNRAKNGEPSTHPLSGVELRGLRRLKRESIESPFVFVSERGSPFTTAGYRKMIARLGEAARLSFPMHPHILRHACSYKLANDGRDTRALQHYLRHKSIQRTVRYTKLSPDRFRDFWRD